MCKTSGEMQKELETWNRLYEENKCPYLKERQIEFPKTLSWAHLNQKGEYTLTKSIVDSKGVYAFYEKDIGYGFKHGIEIQTVFMKENLDKLLIQVKTLSGNTFGKGTWLIIREDYFLTLNDAIGHLQGETKVYKPKRKPEIIRPLTEEEIKLYWGLKQ